MDLKKCLVCAGSGKLMGGGMIIKDCHECDGIGKISHVEVGINVNSIKESDGYRQAKLRLMNKNPTLTDEAAEKLLDEAFENERPKRGRKRGHLRT